MLGEDPFGDTHRPSEARIEVATYPEVIALTGLFASLHRRGHPQLPAEAARRFGIARAQLGVLGRPSAAHVQPETRAARRLQSLLQVQ
ncbi:hypothetical protein GCM10017771_93900 [Streptomyces capitiformicae]|uniref:Uncharacterized protein n=1 Tax=Streptomyces capitiformicae TaxID=2014920 RepID=A0A919DQQ6_9ACTN|nr:hypothetical protein GCM10017771_93900 [Streptomyces capitiformicae]